jgi:hypothetical protein
MPRLKQFVYHSVDYTLLRVPLARWQRILLLEQTEPTFCNQIVKIIYAYVEMQDKRPVFCHRIEALRYKFDDVGYYCPPALPDLNLLSGVGDEKVTYLATRREQQEFFRMRYWEIPPLLLDNILDKIWGEYR